MFRRAFFVDAGVRQGCPLSSTFFILVSDCINRCNHKQLHSNDVLSVFADDTAYAFAFTRVVCTALIVFTWVNRTLAASCPNSGRPVIQCVVALLPWMEK